MTQTMPQKTRELHKHHMDSSIWNDLTFRDDDVVVANYGKSGSTWTQQIVAQMQFGPDPDLELLKLPPWLDLRLPPKEVKLLEVEAQTLFGKAVLAPSSTRARTSAGSKRLRRKRS